MTQQQFNEIAASVSEIRDEKGKLKVGYFIRLARLFEAKCGYYDQAEFKTLIEGSKILNQLDWCTDGTHKHTWRHRVERATQRVNTGI